MRAVVTGIAHAVPDTILTNQDLERMVETSDEWIVQRTGISERRIAGKHETTATLSTQAVQNLLAKSPIDVADIDLVICATVTGDMMFPSVSCLVQSAIGAVNAGAVDIGAACAGFIYALTVATSMIESGQIRNAIVVGGDTLTKFIDWTDRGTCVLFGDGAGAVLVEGKTDTDRGVMKTVLLSDGTGARYIDVEVGGSRFPHGTNCAATRRSKIFMAGSEVYRFAVTAIPEACWKVLALANLTAEDIDLFVPHQANLRIIESAAKRLKLPDRKVFVNVDKYGNTSGGSVPIALSEADESGRLKPGMVVMTVGFGAGLVWGANLIRW
ncbi:MAG: beta-ketoacyl-ACP synthase III [Fimbriimonadaceae bacterium]